MKSFVVQCIVDVILVNYVVDSKLQKYSPNEAQKVWERPITRKVTHKFNPSQALELLKLGSPTLDTIDSEGKEKLIWDYLDVSDP